MTGHQFFHFSVDYFLCPHLSYLWLSTIMSHVKSAWYTNVPQQRVFHVMSNLLSISSETLLIFFIQDATSQLRCKCKIVCVGACQNSMVIFAGNKNYKSNAEKPVATGLSTRL